MGILIWCFFGGLAGYCARAVMPGSYAERRPMSITLGVIGALLGGATGAWISERSGITELDLLSLYLAMSASLCLLLVYRGYAMRFEN